MNDPIIPAAVRSVDDLSELAGKINAAYLEGKEAGERYVNFHRKAGEWLIKVKDRTPDGQWEAWIEKNCKFTPRHARRLMKLHRDWIAAPTDKPFTIEQAYAVLADTPTPECSSADTESADEHNNVGSESERKNAERKAKAQAKREEKKKAALAAMQLTLELDPAEKERRDANEQLAAWRDAIKSIKKGVAELVAGCAGFNLRRQARLSEIPLSESQKESYNVHAGLGALPTYTKVYSWPALDVLEALFDKLTTLNHMRTFE